MTERIAAVLCKNQSCVRVTRMCARDSVMCDNGVPLESCVHGSSMQKGCQQTEAKMHDQRQAALSSNIITAFTS